jgi:pimeloyl-ACP methyl ester carboxylesterase
VSAAPQEIVVEVGRRHLDVELSGPDAGPAVIFHTGTPSGGTVFAGWAADGEARGLRHVSYARPGYASSTRAEGRSVADCAADVQAIADALAIERFYNVGWSGGGPHALACAALLGERVIATGLLAGVAPLQAPGLDWLAGMGQDNVEEFRATEAGPAALERFLAPHAQEMASASAADIQEAFGDLLSDVDREALTGGFAEFLAASSVRAVTHGVYGWLDDDIAFMNEWGFALDAIAGPVSIWQGRHDLMVPFDHGRWLAENVPGADAHLLEAEGHVSLVIGAYGDVLDGLLSRDE